MKMKFPLLILFSLFFLRVYTAIGFWFGLFFVFPNIVNGIN